MYEILSNLPESVAYTCVNCTEHHPAEWRLALTNELQASLRYVLNTLLNSRTASHLLRYRQVGPEAWKKIFIFIYPKTFFFWERMLLLFSMLSSKWDVGNVYYFQVWAAYYFKVVFGRDLNRTFFLNHILLYISLQYLNLSPSTCLSGMICRLLC